MLQAFEELYSTFLRDEEIARGIQSPNSVDDEEIKMGIVGFSYNAPTEEWNIDEYEFLKRTVSSAQDFSGRERLFYALGLGFLLGLVRAGKLDCEQLKTALAQLPGFILLKGGRF
jgi:hypothetical protein